MNALVHHVFRVAVDNGLVTRNPASAAHVARQKDIRAEQRTQSRFWRAEELNDSLAHTADDRLGSLWALIRATGMRRGEALGLQWGDVECWVDDTGRLVGASRYAATSSATPARITPTRRGRAVVWGL